MNTVVFGFICPTVDNVTCESKCEEMGQNPVVRVKNLLHGQYQCKYRSCECSKENCTVICYQNPYKILMDQFGCIKCECFCPRIDCDANCGGESLGIVGPRDELGCFTCAGCTHPNNTNGMINNIIIHFHLEISVSDPGFFIGGQPRGVSICMLGLCRGAHLGRPLNPPEEMVE